MANMGIADVKSAAQDAINKVQDKIPTSLKEGELTKQVEKQTAKIPSIGFLGLAVGSMVLSAGLAIFAERKEWANFVGQWVPSLLLIGVYNKLVKLEGSDQYAKPENLAA